MAEVGVFESHLRDAIALNRVRASVYARMSMGKSRTVSGALILSETATLPLARWYDSRSRAYHDKGVPLLEALFVPMSGLPEPALTDISEDRMNAMRRHIQESLQRVRTVSPRLRELAAERALPDPQPLLQKLIWWHERALPLCDRLDALARPLHQQGIPILIHDLPVIPPWPAEWHDVQPTAR